MVYSQKYFFFNLMEFTDVIRHPSNLLANVQIIPFSSLSSKVKSELDFTETEESTEGDVMPDKAKMATFEYVVETVDENGEVTEVTETKNIKARSGVDAKTRVIVELAKGTGFDPDTQRIVTRPFKQG